MRRVDMRREKKLLKWLEMLKDWSCEFRRNTARFSTFASVAVVIRDTIVNDNHATGNGGAIHVSGNTGALSVISSQMESNAAQAHLTELMRHPNELAANPSAWMPRNYREALITC